MNLRELGPRFSVCRLAPQAAVPEIMRGGCFSSTTRTEKELSIVCESDRVPPGVREESGWAAFEVEGPLDFGLTGILSSLTAPLAEARLGVFAISTFDTDYLLVRRDTRDRAVEALREAGHRVVCPRSAGSPESTRTTGSTAATAMACPAGETPAVRPTDEEAS